jgi:hypothetical protein
VPHLLGTFGPGSIRLGLFLALIHLSAWNESSANFVLKLSEKRFEQRFSSEFGRYMNTRWTKISTMDDPEDLAISALGTFQTISVEDSAKFALREF